MSRVAIVCPGRGSYTEATLRSLPPEHEFVQAAEKLRADYGLESLLALDGAPRFEPARHLRPAHVSALIYTASMIDAQKVWADHEVVCVLGNSMGWYTSLAVAGSLSFEDGFHLVQRMALWQETGVAGGQLIYPLVNEDWQPVPERKAAALAAIAAHPGQLFLSIDLGGYLVLAGSDAGLAAARKALPPVQQGGVPYPLRLAQHGPYHTPLAQGVSDAAVADLSGLPMALPRAPMIDGTGRCWSPWSSDLEALRRYTLVDQVIKPYDLRAGIAVAIKEFAPERLMLLGPGNTLGGITGQVLLAETWKGLKTRDDFRAHQAGPDAMVVSMGLARA